MVVKSSGLLLDSNLSKCENQMKPIDIKYKRIIGETYGKFNTETKTKLITKKKRITLP